MTGILCSIAGATYAAAARTAITVTANGNAQVDTAQSKLGGASALFDGTGDYLLIDSTNSSSLNFGTGNFTLEFFARATVRDQFHTIIANNKSSWTAGSVTILGGSGSTSTTALRLAANSFNSGGAGIVYDNQAMTTGVWYHYAITRSGNDFTMYRDGTSVSTGTFSGSINLGEDGTRIGYTRWDGDVSTWDGHIDEIRISNSVRYTTSFTPTTTPFTFDSNTLLLLHCDGTDATTVFTDDIGTNAIPRTPKTVTANGNAQVDTAQSKFGGASALFDGTTDGLSVDNSDFAFGTGDFTYECFVRVADTNAFMLFDGTTPTGSSNAVSVWAQLGALYVYSGGWTYQGVGTINNNTWYHVAVSRSSSNIRVFVDGTQVGSTTAFSINFTQNILHMGKARVDAGYDGNGHMDEIRVSNSARYTANFTAPAAAFTNDRNTLLLLHCNGTDASTTFTDDNVNP